MNDRPDPIGTAPAAVRQEVRAERKVLIVDDDVDFVESLRDVLEPFGYQTVVATTPAEARTLLATVEIRVVLIDIGLGSTRGTELLAELKQRYPEAVFIMMTAHAELGPVIEALRGGASDYLLKPSDPREPLLALERCFEKLQLQHDYKIAYEQMLAAKTAAEEANQAKSQFLANMSHELRTPLNAILGFSEFLTYRGAGLLDPAKIREYATSIHKSGAHLLEVINDILDLARVEAGHFELKDEEVEIHKAVASVMLLVEPRAHEGKIRLSSTVVPELPRIRGDERVLRQMLLNLLSNAIKFTPEDGRIEIAAWTGADRGVVIAVSDTGIGIEPDNIPKVFMPFRQIHNPYTHKYPGTGLGLPLVKAMMEAHGGTVQIDSKLNAGTTVTIRFPADRTLVPWSERRYLTR
jgi:signal transduction histidine kinase